MKTWNLKEIVEETGELHNAMGDFLNEYLKGSETHGKVYLNTLKRMHGNRPVYVIEFYQHLYDSAKTIVQLNKEMK